MDITVRVSVSLPENAVSLIDSLCGGKGGMTGISSGRSHWIRQLVLKELGMEEEENVSAMIAQKKRGLPNPYRGQNHLEITYTEVENGERPHFVIESWLGSKRTCRHEFHLPKALSREEGMKLKRKVESSIYIHDFLFLCKDFVGQYRFKFEDWDTIRKLRPLQ